MKKLGIKLFIIAVLFSLVSACNTLKPPKTPPPQHQASKKLEYEAMLSDPLIKKDFRALKKVAMTARVYRKDGNVYFTKEDLSKLNELSELLITRLEYHYHLDRRKHKTHTYIGKNQYDSCYQYYNSLDSHSVRQDCEEFSANFGTCQQCNSYIKKLRLRNKQIIHAAWWSNESTAALVDTFKLSNGDSVYIGLEFSK